MEDFLLSFTKVRECDGQPVTPLSKIQYLYLRFPWMTRLVFNYLPQLSRTFIIRCFSIFDLTRYLATIKSTPFYRGSFAASSYDDVVKDNLFVRIPEEFNISAGKILQAPSDTLSATVKALKDFDIYSGSVIFVPFVINIFAEINYLDQLSFTTIQQTDYAYFEVESEKVCESKDYEKLREIQSTGTDTSRFKWKKLQEIIVNIQAASQGHDGHGSIVNDPDYKQACTLLKNLKFITGDTRCSIDSSNANFVLANFSVQCIIFLRRLLAVYLQPKTQSRTDLITKIYTDWYNAKNMPDRMLIDVTYSTSSIDGMTVLGFFLRLITLHPNIRYTFQNPDLRSDLRFLTDVLKNLGLLLQLKSPSQAILIISDCLTSLKGRQAHREDFSGALFIDPYVRRPPGILDTSPNVFSSAMHGVDPHSSGESADNSIVQNVKDNFIISESTRRLYVYKTENYAVNDHHAQLLNMIGTCLYDFPHMAVYNLKDKIASSLSPEMVVKFLADSTLRLNSTKLKIEPTLVSSLLRYDRALKMRQSVTYDTKAKCFKFLEPKKQLSDVENKWAYARYYLAYQTALEMGILLWYDRRLVMDLGPRMRRLLTLDLYVSNRMTDIDEIHRIWADIRRVYESTENRYLRLVIRIDDNTTVSSFVSNVAEKMQ